MSLKSIFFSFLITSAMVSFAGSHGTTPPASPLSHGTTPPTSPISPKDTKKVQRVLIPFVLNK